MLEFFNNWKLANRVRKKTRSGLFYKSQIGIFYFKYIFTLNIIYNWENLWTVTTFLKFYFLGFGRFALTIFADFSLIFFKKYSFHIFQYTKKCTQNVCRFLFFIKIFRFQNFVAFHEKSSIFLFYKLSCKTTLISFFILSYAVCFYCE